MVVPKFHYWYQGYTQKTERVKKFMCRGHDSSSAVGGETAAPHVPILLGEKCIAPQRSEMALRVESDL